MNPLFWRICRGCVPVTFAVCSASPCLAQGYPAKPIRFIAPYPAGGVNDIVARIIGQRMSQAFSQQWVIEI